mmetsp:Transcript_20102/g.51188  ORF Transcript_20102/g.51188 Transcript_20102/m.51188 type:complete len:231 (+) Transcript_20102:3278-3970(+)
MHVRRVENSHQLVELPHEFGHYPLEFCATLAREQRSLRLCVRKDFTHEQIVRRLHQHNHILGHLILVLAEHSCAGVNDFAGVVDHFKLVLVLEYLLEAATADVLLEQLLVQSKVRTLRHDALLVHHGEDAVGVRLDQVQHLLVVEVREVGVLDLHTLHSVLLLRRGEDGLVEAVLQLLIREVDAQLLQRVVLEHLEPENVQDAHKEPCRPPSHSPPRRLPECQRLVHAGH